MLSQDLKAISTRRVMSVQTEGAQAFRSFSKMDFGNNHFFVSLKMLPKVPEIIHTGDRWHISQTASNEVKPTRPPHIVFFKMNLLKKQNLSNIVADVLFHRVTRMLVTVQLKLMHKDFSSSYAAFYFLWTSLEPGLKLLVLQKTNIQYKYRGKLSPLHLWCMWCDVTYSGWNGWDFQGKQL